MFLLDSEERKLNIIVMVKQARYRKMINIILEVRLQ
jgi:hypothetical protein